MLDIRKTAAALLCLSLTLQATGAAAADFITDGDRALPGGRAIEVEVGQAEIRSSIDMSSGTPGLAAFGLLGALASVAVSSSINSSRAKHGETNITPIRDTLTKFDADALATATTRNAIARIDWLRTDQIGFTKDITPLGGSKVLDAAKTTQVAFMAYSYEMAPDFGSVRVMVNVFLVDKAQPSGDAKPEDRMRGRNMVYQKMVRTAVLLPNAPGKPADNAARWAADDGQLVKAALIQGFGTLETLIPRSLAATESDEKAYRKGKHLEMADYAGKTVEHDGDHALLWEDGYISIDPLKPVPAVIPAVATPPVTPTVPATPAATPAPASTAPAPTAS